MSREDKERKQQLQNALVRLAFKLRLSDQVLPFRAVAKNMLLMDNVA